MPLSKAQIGRCGELLVQFKLLMHGIESSALTTDAGIDLVAFSDQRQRAITIQVKTNRAAKPGGGRASLLSIGGQTINPKQKYSHSSIYSHLGFGL